jgi:(1->4)-alpha-D-glucan 1-alpha-D-glucosylmutase
VIHSTYRLQLSSRFPFAAARAVVPYLADLGVSHLYVSPVLRARTGSDHGYDVVDPTEVSPELGGEEGLRRLVALLRGHGMGLVVDLVPNHMAVSHENPWWLDVLRHGQASAFAPVFDIDWAVGGGRVRLPVLGGPLDQVAAELEVTDGWARYHAHRFPLAPGTDRLDQQHYELVDWRRAATDGNYRRFFAVNDLVGVCQEDPEVFRLTHATILRLVADGLVDGIRIDHVDGLADPAGYLERLAAAGVPWVVVEKILETGERLPSWPVAGTTGYDFLAQADGLLVDPAAAGPFTDRYTSLTGRDPNAVALAVSCKRDQLERSFGSEVAGVVRSLPADPRGGGRPAGAPPRGSPDPSAAADRAAVVELAAQFPVYRTYVAGAVAEQDRAVLAAARGAVEDCLWAAEPVEQAALDRLVGTLGGERPAPEAVRRFQQLTGPAMAKGVEDTALYRDVRLLARNEVGGDLAGFGLPATRFHAANAERERRWPVGMLATSTHDTKRAEDVRARLAALTDDPDRWWSLAERWTTRLVRSEGLGGIAAVDPGDALILWQTMVGAWPLERERCLAYMEKAVREAGLHTSWTEPDPAYEAAVHDLVGRAYADRELLAELEALVADLAPAGRARAAGLALLRLTAPGVPDTYQGTETEQLVLVDPDNRRPVGFRADGSLKFLVTRTALRLRRDRPGLFAGYRPLAAPDHLVAYARGLDRLAVVVSCRPGPAGGTVGLPPGRWRELLTGGGFDGGPTSVGDLLAATPHALLVREDRPGGSERP